MEKSKFSLSQKTFKSMNAIEQRMRNKAIFISLILISAVLFVIMLIFNALAGNPNLIKGGPFHHSIGNISAMYPLNITPAGWAFSIWGVIYLLQFGSTLYSLGLLCRTTVDDQPAYNSPAVLSPLYFLLISLSCILNVGWLFQWDRMLFSASVVFLAVTCLTLCSAISISSTRLAFFQTELIDSGRKTDVRVIQAVVINGLGMYATWSIVATLINLGVAIVYRWPFTLNLSDEKASVICVGILFAIVLIYSVLDLTVLDHCSRYIFTPYLTVIWALSAIIAKNWDVSNKSSILCAVLLSAVSVLFVVKLALVWYRVRKILNPYRRLKVNTIRLQSK